MPPRSDGAAVEHVVGIDLGGTKIAAGLIDAHGRILATETCPTDPQAGSATVIRRVADLAHRLFGVAKRPLAVGVGTAGQVDSTRGLIVAGSRRLPPDWPGTPLRDLLRTELDLPVAVLNDGQAMALGELHFGAAQGVQHAICLAIGTGVGGGLVMHGQLYTGATGLAGLLGHTLFRYAGRRCPCGRPGHLEAYVSGPRVSRRYQQLGGTTGVSGVFAAASRGDAVAEQALREAAHCLGAALASLVNTLDPELIIIGGGVLEAGPSFVERMRDELARQATPALAGRIRLVSAQLGLHASMVGAAVAAFLATGRKPVPAASMAV